VVDLLDYDVRFGQGFLFAPPRPVRPEGAAGSSAEGEIRTEPDGSTKPAGIEAVGAELTQRLTGNAALVRRAAGPV
jgi:cyclic-di-GMP phosphodiesterase, flagellum assembly factor TipF